MRRSRPLPLLVAGVLLATAMAAPAGVAAANPTFTILDTNDFHGQLEPSGSNPGAARVAAVVNDVRTSVGAGNVLLVDAGDEMQGSLLSNLQHGAPTIATFNAMGYAAATFGNHEFDWGQPNLADRTAQAGYPFLTANIVKNDTGNCATAGWQKPDFADATFTIQTVNGVNVGLIGVTTTETPTITVSTATAGLCFKDPADSILHYYDAMKTAGADVVVVLSHLGLEDGGYGYGIPVYGDKSLAAKLNTAGKPANLIIGGHSHTNMTTASVVGPTTVVQAYYNGRAVGRSDVTFDPVTKAVSITWTKLAVSTSGAQDATVAGVISTYATDPDYLALVNTPIGYSAVDLPRSGGSVDNMMGTFVDDAIYGYLNTDADPANDIDVFFNNAGGIRTDWCWSAADSKWIGTGCAVGTHAPGLLTYGNMFTILPFGNATVVGSMTGAQILDVLNHGPQMAGSATIQPAGLKYGYYAYRDKLPGPQPYAWGAFDYCVVDKVSKACEPLELDRTYRVGTNEFLAPAGGDGYGAFKYMTDITYWGDMLNAVDAYVTAHYGTPETAYAGPNGNGTLDGRILRDGTDDGGSIVPLTILHHNDSHGNLSKGSFVGMTQLATLIKQERAHNPTRTMLVSGGDNIQGDAMSYYFKSAPSGFAADGTPLPAALQKQPIIALMNALGYDAMTLGNHEFNFGSVIFGGIFAQAQFPLLGANVSDDGRYGLASVGPGGEGVQPYVEKDLGGIRVAILGITNHRVPNYELPSNIVGLTFSNPIDTAKADVPGLRANNDVVVALTHIGFTTNPKSVEVDNNVDTNLAADVPGVDAIIGSHSHTNPANPEAPYKSLPVTVAGPNNTPVLINQAYRYNNTLGEVVLGLRALPGGGYEVVARTGQYLSVTMSTPEDPEAVAIVQPYVDALNAYNTKVVGQTTAPIDALQAFTQETNGANLQADAATYELNQHGIFPDVHLSGAMTNKAIAAGATPGSPVTLKVSDMFTLMPYENSLVTLRMNGPQLKAVLERAYRNFYYYKYVPGYGGYSYYTTCMIDTNSIGKITYNDLYPAAYDATKNHVVSLSINGHDVDFTDASTTYLVSTVNYLAAGSCNFNDGGVSLWPLDQIVNDTQFYVRDAVIDYVTAMGTVSPAIEGRLQFITDTDAPSITITSPTATSYAHSALLTLDFGAVDVGDAGLASVTADLDGTTVTDGQVIDLMTLPLGTHTLTVSASDKAGNTATAHVDFTVRATVASLKATVNRLYAEGKIKNTGIRDALLSKLTTAQAYVNAGNDKAARSALNAFINQVMAQKGKGITVAAANLLISDARYVIAHL